MKNDKTGTETGLDAKARGSRSDPDGYTVKEYFRHVTVWMCSNIKRFS